MNLESGWSTIKKRMHRRKRRTRWRKRRNQMDAGIDMVHDAIHKIRKGDPPDFPD